MTFVDATIVNIAFPDVRRSFPEISLSDLSWILNAYNIVFAAFLVVAGRFADLVGRKRLFQVGLIVFTGASVLCSVAPSSEFLIAARIVQALGAAIIVPASLALVLHAFPAGERAHAVGLWTASAALAAGLGPSLGGLLVEASSWRLVFLVNLPVGIAAFVLARHLLVESRTPGRRRLPDVPGAFLMAASIGLLTLGIVKGGDWGWSDPRAIGSFAGALALGGLFVHRSLSHREPVVDFALFRVRSFATANLITVIAATGYFAYLLCNVLFLTSVWGYSVLEAGLAMSPGPFVAAAVAGPASELADRLGYPAVLAPGALIWAGGVAMLIMLVGTEPAFVGEWLPTQVVLGVGAGICLPTISAAGVASAPGERFATATGLNSVARQLGAALGVALLVAIVGTPGVEGLAAAFDDGWSLAAGCFVFTALAALTLGHVRSSADVAQAELAADAAARRASLARAGSPPAPRVNPVSRSAPRAYRSPFEFLRSVALFSRLDDRACHELAVGVTVVELRAGSWLFREGDPADAMYVVAAGQLEVIASEASDRPIRAVGRGAAIGEFALLTDAPRVAGVRARRDSRLLRLGRDRFESLLDRYPGFAASLASDLASRLQQVRGQPTPGRTPPTTIAVVPLTDAIPAQRIAEELARALGDWERSVLLRSPEQGDRHSHAERLDRAQKEHDQTVLETRVPTDNDAWTELCLADADRILAITAGGPVPAWLRDRAALRGCDLVQFAPDPDAAPLSSWWEILEPATCHRVDPGDEFVADVRRTARRLSGRSLGLVLSGGGARALAHIGVLEELTEAGVVIDRVGGTSMGAYIGAMVAMGMGPVEIDARCYEEWVRRYPLNDYRLPRVSLIRGEKVLAMLERTFGDRTIEGLPLNFYCTSSDLVHHEVVVHREGLLREQVAAGIRMPILAPPQPRGNRILVDGSVLNNLPVEPMAAAGEGPILAVDIRVGAAPNGGEQPLEEGGANGSPTPPLLETLARVILVGSSDTAAAAALHSDLVITPNTDGVGLFEFHQIDAAREAGREAARVALELLPAEQVGA